MLRGKENRMEGMTTETKRKMPNQRVLIIFMSMRKKELCPELRLISQPTIASYPKVMLDNNQLTNQSRANLYPFLTLSE